MERSPNKIKNLIDYILFFKHITAHAYGIQCHYAQSDIAEEYRKEFVVLHEKLNTFYKHWILGILSQLNAGSLKHRVQEFCDIENDINASLELLKQNQWPQTVVDLIGNVHFFFSSFKQHHLEKVGVNPSINKRSDMGEDVARLKILCLEESVAST
ncbi:MAG: hypothetical protein H6908_06845 [Hyphomicrobiales bacterium]|nr:hypothetical protein [Rickettsiales bacterium]MCP5362329.1 hypothetical protein [Hyphomicrobiales bacterium]